MRYRSLFFILCGLYWFVVCGVAVAAPASPAATVSDATDQQYVQEILGMTNARGLNNTEMDSLQKRAEQGYAPAQYCLGILYSGKRIGGVEREDSISKAFEWFQKAAVQGFAAAQFQLGMMYSSGYKVSEAYGGRVLVPEDKGKAMEWYEKAAASGLTEAQYKLGEMYEEGQDVTQNHGKAMEWMQKAAGQGHEQAKQYLGWL